MSTRGASKISRASGPATVYLIAYNLLSKCAWGYILYLAVQHLLALSPAPVAKSSASATVSSIVQTVLSYLPSALRGEAPLSEQAKAKVWDYVPASLLPYVTRAKTFYAVAGPEVALVQSFAILEVLHVILGLVPSPLVTTAMQVASRLWIVWGVVERFPETHTHPLYTNMVVAWCLAEIIRYQSYTLALAGYKPYWLQWLRYTAFYILYPVGAGSEAFLMLSTVPSFSSIGTSAWALDDYLRGLLFIVWWPSLYSLMSYMSSQRRKVLGGGSKGKRKAE